MPIPYQVLPLNNYDYIQYDTSEGIYVHSTTRLKILVVYNDTY